MKKIELNISWMHCSSCSKIIELKLSKNEFIKNSFINVSSNKWLIEYDENNIEVTDIIKIIKDAWYDATLKNKTNWDEAKDWLKKSLFSFILSLPLIIFMFYDLIKWLPFEEKIMPIMAVTWLIIWTIIQFSIWKIFYKWAYAALRQKTFNMYSLIAIWTTAAYFFSLYNITNYYIIHWNIIPEMWKIHSIYFEVSVLLITFVVFWKYLETKTKSKTSNAVKKLMSITPNIVNIFTLKWIIQKDIQDVKIWDIFIVKAWEKIPCDWEIISWEALVDESMLNWESSLVNKKVKDEVFAWSLNNFSNFKAVIKKTPNNFLINQIITILKDVSFKKTDIENLSDTISKYFVPIVIIISIITFISWYFIWWVWFEKSLIFATSVLVIACPCALWLATPTAIMVWTWVWANSWILIKNPNSLQKAWSINAIVFDKTWTLTTWKLEVSDLIQTNNQNYQDLVNIIYSIESESNHPISKAIIKYCKKFDAKMLKVSDFELENWKWISAKIWSDDYKIWNKNYINLDTDSFKKYSEFENQAKTTIAISKNNEIIWIIALWDQIKDESYDAIKILHKNNIETYIVSWDNQKTTNIVWKTLNFKKQNLLWEILPHQKFEFVKKLQSQWKKVAFVWDWINDSVALSWSDLWISMSSWSDIAMESGDIVLIKNDIRDVWESIKISKLTIWKIKQNLFFSLIYNISWIPIAAWVFYFAWYELKPEFAWLAMIFSSICVVINSLLLKYKSKLISNISIFLIFSFFSFLFYFLTSISN